MSRGPVQPESTQAAQDQITVDDAKQLVRDRDLVMQLVNGDAWKRIIEELYFKDEILRLVNASANFSLTKEQRDNIKSLLPGIPGLRNFIGMVISQGNQAEADLRDYEEEAGSAEVN